MEQDNRLKWILPVPKSIAGGDSEGIYPPHIRVQDDMFSRYVPVCREYIGKFCGIMLTEGDGGICLCRDDTLSGEAYRIRCTPEGIFLYSAGTKGMDNALSTLYQILRNGEGNPVAPMCTIEDVPDCAYRTVMVDLPAWRTLEVISRDVVVTAWESLYHLPQDLLAEGFTITNVSWMPLYMVHPESYHAKFVKDGRWQPEEILTDWTVYTWKNWWEKSFAYKKPIVAEPTPQVIGATFCVWLTDFAVELPVIRENLPAMCERIWNTDSTLAEDEFRKRFVHLASLADKL